MQSSKQGGSNTMQNLEIIKKHLQNHDSFYLYDAEIIKNSIKKLQNNFPNITFLYSLKTNPHKEIIKTIFAQGVGADAASFGEVRLSLQNKLAPELIQYSTPGKTRENIAEALESTTIIADSLNEIFLIQEIAKDKNIQVKIGVRLNPNFTFFGNSGVVNKFGIDEDQFFAKLEELKSLSHVTIAGIHVHSRSQELDFKIIFSYYEKLFSLISRVQTALNAPLQFVNMGSGIGINYALEDSPLDVVSLGKMTADLIDSQRKNFPDLKIFIETGRYLVGKSGIYVAKVLDYKISHGKKFVILANTLNGFIRPSLAKLVESYSQEEKPFMTEPLFTCKNAFPLLTTSTSKEEECVSLVGNLCTAADVVATDVVLPKLEIGDGVIFSNAGSYAAVLSPMQFSSQVPPVEIFME